MHPRRAPSALLAPLLVALLAGCFAKDVPAAPVGEPAFALEGVLEGLSQPVYATHAGDGSGDLYILEQAGRIRVWDGDGQPETFLDLTGRVGSGGERGLLGLAFDPEEGAASFYVHYTDRGGDTVLSRFRGPAAQEEILLRVDQPYPNHNGGSLLFGPDGMLYLALGDGGSAGDPENHAQDRDDLLGKILRLDVRGGAGEGGRAYRIPADNPFADGEDGAAEVWAYGLRNPWRISFDRATGDLWIADVGQNHVEEINRAPADSRGGENYGWPWYEGTQRYRRAGNPPATVRPVAEYDHDGGHCSVTGGYVYRGQDVPALRGAYLFADYCSGQSWTLRPDGGEWALRRGPNLGFMVSSFAEDEEGELYAVDHGGSLHRVVAA